SGLAAYWLVRGLGSVALAAWIAAVAFTIAPFRMNHFSHLELQMTMLMPIVVLSVWRGLKDGSPGDGGGVGGCLVAQWYSSMYYGLFLTLYGAGFGAVLAIAWKGPPRRIAYCVAAIGIAGALVLPLVSVYAQSTSARGVRSPEVITAFSAVP